MTPALRDYQDGGLYAVKTSAAAGVRRQLISLPTGTGKTVLFANLPTIGFRRLLIVAHREELLDQAADKLRHWNPGLSVQVDQADRRADLDAVSMFDSSDGYAVCASVATIGRKGSSRLTRYPANHFDALVIDEAHHSSAQSYQSVIEHFRAGEPGGPLLLGVTATPFRADGADLSKVFDKIVYSLDLPTAIEQKYLVDIRAIAVQTKTDLNGVAATREDFKAGELEDAVNTPGRNGKIVKSYLEKAPARKALVFCAGVQHSKDLTEAFLNAGVPAEHLDGTTPKEVRKGIISRLKSGETSVVCNCGVLTEGFDEPSISCVILARPTKSGVLYAQMIGRGTRLSEGKTDLLLIDVADLSSRHTLVNAAAMFGIPTGLDLEGQSAMAVRKKVKQLVQMDIPFEEMAKAQRFADLDKIANQYRELKLWSPQPSNLVKGISRLQWISTADQRLSLRVGDLRATVSIDLLGKAKLLVIRRGERTPLGITGPDETLASLEFPSLPQAVVAADLVVSAEAPKVFLDPNASWRKAPASEKQLEILRKKRVPFHSNLTKGEASILLDKAFARSPRGAARA